MIETITAKGCSTCPFAKNQKNQHHKNLHTCYHPKSFSSATSWDIRVAVYESGEAPRWCPLKKGEYHVKLEEQLVVHVGYFVHLHHDLYSGLQYYGVFEEEEEADTFAKSLSVLPHDEINVIKAQYVMRYEKAHVLNENTEVLSPLDFDEGTVCP